MVKGKARGRGKNTSAAQGQPAPAPAPFHVGPGQPTTFAASNRNTSNVVNLSTMANGLNHVKRIEMTDRPGEARFSEALAKALGPSAKCPTARQQICSLIHILEPEAVVNGFNPSALANADPNIQMMMQLMHRQSQLMGAATGGGVGNLSALGNYGAVPSFGTVPYPAVLAPGGMIPGATIPPVGVVPPVVPPAYTAKTLGMLLKQQKVTITEVNKICAEPNIAFDVNEVCDHAYPSPVTGSAAGFQTPGGTSGTLRSQRSSSRRTGSSVRFESMGQSTPNAPPL